MPSVKSCLSSCTGQECTLCTSAIEGDTEADHEKWEFNGLCAAGIPEGVQGAMADFWSWLWVHGWTRADIELGISRSEQSVLDTLQSDGASRRDADLLLCQALQRQPRLMQEQANAIMQLYAVYYAACHQSPGQQ